MLTSAEIKLHFYANANHLFCLQLQFWPFFVNVRIHFFFFCSGFYLDPVSEKKLIIIWILTEGTRIQNNVYAYQRRLYFRYLYVTYQCHSYFRISLCYPRAPQHLKMTTMVLKVVMVFLSNWLVDLLSMGFDHWHGEVFFHMVLISWRNVCNSKCEPFFLKNGNFVVS